MWRCWKWKWFLYWFDLNKWLVEPYQDSQIYLGGNFNTDFVRFSAHSDILSVFCNTNNVFRVVSHENSEIDYTYNFCVKWFRKNR